MRPGAGFSPKGRAAFAIFALQFAKVAGARVVALSSNEEKIARLRELGADATINYRTTPQWSDAVRKATGGVGVDIAVETTGASLSTTIAATRFGGFIGVVGFVGGYEAKIEVRQLISAIVTVRGMSVGSRRQFEAMCRAIDMHGIKPVVDSVFPFTQAGEALAKNEARRTLRQDRPLISVID